MTIEDIEIIHHPSINPNKKLAVFSNTNPSSQIVQDKLAELALIGINQQYIRKLFTDNVEGDFYIEFESEEKLRAHMESRLNLTDAIFQILANTKNPQLIYGIADSQQQKPIQNLSKEIIILTRKRKQETITPDEEEELVEKKELLQSKVEKYSMLLGKNIFDYMQKNSLSSAGAILGKKHFEYMLDYLTDNHFEIISFHPSKQITPLKNLEKYSKLNLTP